jgi:tetratricopeptide (TPR) repeat protein
MSYDDDPPRSSTTPLARFIVIFIIIGFVGSLFLTTPTALTYFDPKGMVFWMPIILLIATWIVIGAGVMAFTRRQKTFLEANDSALALMESGRYTEAEAALQKLLRRMPREAILRYNMAILCMRQGHFQRAFGILGELPRSAGKLREFLIPVAYASLHALASELDVAEQAYDEASDLVNNERQGMLAVTRAVLALRRGAYKIVAEMPQDEWFAAEGVGPAGHMRRLRILRAFAIFKLPPADRNEKSDAEMQQMLSGSRPFHPGEYDFLAAKLPELRAFLVEQSLSRPAAQAALPAVAKR